MDIDRQMAVDHVAATVLQTTLLEVLYALVMDGFPDPAGQLRATHQNVTNILANARNRNLPGDLFEDAIDKAQIDCDRFFTSTADRLRNIHTG